MTAITPFYGPGVWSYQEFIRKSVGVPIAALPDDSIYFEASFGVSLDIVNIELSFAPQMGAYTAPNAPPKYYPSQYALAVYNLGAHTLICTTPDAEPPYIFPGSVPPTGYFEWLRKKYNVNSFTSGVVTYAADLSTSASYQVADWMKNMTLADLGNLNTPWGRAYLGIAQQYGPTIVGIT